MFVQGGLSALMLCCEAGNSEMAELLLNSHANPDLQQSVCTLSLNSILYMCKYNDIRERSIIYYCIHMYSVYIVCHRTQDIQL